MSDNSNEKGHPSQKFSSPFLEFLNYLLFLIGPLVGNVILVLFGVLSQAFAVTPDSILVAIPAFMFPFAIVQLFSGAISDLKGRFPVMFVGMVIFGVGMIIGAFSTSLVIYVVSNVLGGIGFGFVNPVIIALITDITEPRNIPKKMGILGAVAYLGVGLGPFIASLFVVIGWRFLYILLASLVGFSLICILIIKKPPKLVAESSLKEFVSNLGIELKRPVVIVLILTIFLTAQTTIGAIIWTSRSFTGVLSEVISGLILIIAGVCGAITGMTFGPILKKKGLKLAILISLLLIYFGYVLLAFLGSFLTPEGLLIISVGLILVASSGGMLIPIVLFYSQTLSKGRRGALAGLATAGQFIGIALVPILYQPFFDAGGIHLIYFAQTILSLILAIFLIALYYLANKEIEQG